MSRGCACVVLCDGMLGCVGKRCGMGYDEVRCCVVWCCVMIQCWYGSVQRSVAMCVCVVMCCVV